MILDEEMSDMWWFSQWMLWTPAEVMLWTSTLSEWDRGVCKRDSKLNLDRYWFSKPVFKTWWDPNICCTKRIVLHIVISMRVAFTLGWRVKLPQHKQHKLRKCRERETNTLHLPLLQTNSCLFPLKLFKLVTPFDNTNYAYSPWMRSLRLGDKNIS